MIELTVISGKGGTGKSSIARALIDCAENCSVSDCDVDAANMHLVLKHGVLDKEIFKSGFDYAIDPERCISCGLCEERCAFDAIHDCSIDHFSCEGCGVCHYFCPADAVTKAEKETGELIRAQSEGKPFIYARLHPGEENSGKLVSRVREVVKETAAERGSEYIIHDGPPGIGCPVIASVTGATAALIVSEPTVSGYEDYVRVRELLKFFRMPFFVCVNRGDINTEMVEKFRQDCENNGGTYAGTIDYDPVFSEVQSQGVSVLEGSSEKIKTQIRNLWETIEMNLHRTDR